MPAQDLFNIAPKRPNWDLKRELDKKLAKLERKTQESIHTLIRTFHAFPKQVDTFLNCASVWYRSTTGSAKGPIGRHRRRHEGAGTSP